MGMSKRLVRHGNSLALIIDRPLCLLLGIEKTTVLDLRLDGRTLHITPQGPQTEHPEFDAALAKANKRYGKMLKRLVAEECEPHHSGPPGGQPGDEGG